MRLTLFTTTTQLPSVEPVAMAGSGSGGAGAAAPTVSTPPNTLYLLDHSLHTSSLEDDLALKATYPLLTILGKKTWAEYGIEVEDEPRIDTLALKTTLGKLFASLKMEKQFFISSGADGKESITEAYSGITLLLMPRGLALSHLERARHKTASHRTSIFYYNELVRKTLENSNVDKSYWVFISDSVVKGSRGLSLKAQRELLFGKECVMPEALQLIARDILRASRLPPGVSKSFYKEEAKKGIGGFSRWLFGSKEIERNFSSSRCEESSKAGCHVVVGGEGKVFNELDVDFDYYDSGTCGVMATHRI